MHLSKQNIICGAPGLVAQWQRQGFLVSVTWVRALACTPVTPAVFYLHAGLAGCSVGPGISCGARKLARTPRVKKKKKKSCVGNIFENPNYVTGHPQLSSIK